MRSGKLITIIFIAFMVVIALLGLIFGARAFAKQQSDKQEKQAQSEIIERACYELDEPSDGAEIELLMTEDIPWSAYRSYSYVLTCNGRRYLVGVLRNGEEIHYVDVEEDITDRDDFGTQTIRG